MRGRNLPIVHLITDCLSAADRAYVPDGRARIKFAFVMRLRSFEFLVLTLFSIMFAHPTKEALRGGSSERSKQDV